MKEGERPCVRRFEVVNPFVVRFPCWLKEKSNEEAKKKRRKGTRPHKYLKSNRGLKTWTRAQFCRMKTKEPGFIETGKYWLQKVDIHKLHFCACCRIESQQIVVFLLFVSKSQCIPSSHWSKCVIQLMNGVKRALCHQNSRNASDMRWCHTKSERRNEKKRQNLDSSPALTLSHREAEWHRPLRSTHFQYVILVHTSWHISLYPSSLALDPFRP